MAKLTKTNPFDPSVLMGPHTYNRYLREEAPVYHCQKTGIYFVSTYDLVMEVAKNEKVYSSKFSTMMKGDQARDEELLAIQSRGFPRIDTMLTQDPPEQRRYRSLCQKPFSVSSVKKLRPYLKFLANDLIDGFIDELSEVG